MLMNSIKKDVDSYYNDKVKTYGATPKGVDWNGEQSQLLRFKQLSKIIKKDKKNFEIVFLSANKDHKNLLAQAQKFNVKNHFTITTDNCRKCWLFKK